MEKGVTFLAGCTTLLRPFEKSTDLATTTRWMNDQAVVHFLGGHPMPVTQAREAEWFDKLGSDDRNVVLAIVAKSEMRLIGSIGLHGIDWVARRAEVGILIGEQEYWSKGYGTDATMTLLAHAFQRLNLRKLTWTALAFNERSTRCALRCGFEPEGVRKRHMFRAGRYWDVAVFGLFEPQFRKAHRQWQKAAG